MTGWKRLAGAAAFCAAQLSAAQFDFSTLIRWGASTGGPANYEMGIGNTPGSPASTGNVTPHFSTDSTRLFQVEYTKAINTATLRVYDGITTAGASDAVSFNPAGGAAAAANATWRLPASSFFVQTAPDISLSQIDVRNLALLTGTVIAPFQTTPMTSSQFLGIGAGTVNHSGDVVFVGDASGNWRLQGLIRMTNIGATSNNALTFGISATASDVPEPMTSALIGLGLIAIAVRGRRPIVRN